MIDYNGYQADNVKNRVILFVLKLKNF